MNASPKIEGFRIGCNYWASHAGTLMWRNWDEASVRRDFAMMRGIGLELIRVFPIWPDFQPLELHCSFHGKRRELQMAGRSLPETEAGKAGVSEEMLKRFRTLADIAQENGMKLLVSLVTGWMSGEIYAPPAFAGLNLLTDPFAVKWQVAFVRCFVKALKDHPAIAIWELGNESNCMAPVENSYQAWGWVNTISSAIRLEDSSRPVGSGMHGLLPGCDSSFDEWKQTQWQIQPQGKLCDLMTSHPYPHSPSKRPARIDPVGSLRSHFQAVVESRMYADMSGKPCLVEEIGTLGALVCDEKTQADFIYNVLWNIWAHDCRGLLWWCGFEQVELEHSPYEWGAWERELGLFRKDYSAKPVAKALTRFRKELDASGLEMLPAFRKDAVCILPFGLEMDEYLEQAWSSFMLAKQAGFDLEFRHIEDPLPESELYILPGVKTQDAIPRSRLLRIMERVKAGATFYLSLDGGHLSPFNEFFGVRVRNREARDGVAEMIMDEERFECASPCRLDLALEGAEAAAVESDGNPAFTCCRYGKGKVWLMTSPIETHLAAKPNAFSPNASPWYRFYQKVAGEVIARRLVRRSNPFVTVTEHFISADRAVAVLHNNRPEAVECMVDLLPGWNVTRSITGGVPDDCSIRIEKYQNAIWLLEKTKVVVEYTEPNAVAMLN